MHLSLLRILLALPVSTAYLVNVYTDYQCTQYRTTINVTGAAGCIVTNTLQEGDSVLITPTNSDVTGTTVGFYGDQQCSSSVLNSNYYPIAENACTIIPDGYAALKLINGSFFPPTQSPTTLSSTTSSITLANTLSYSTTTTGNPLTGPAATSTGGNTTTTTTTTTGNPLSGPDATTTATANTTSSNPFGSPDATTTASTTEETVYVQTTTTVTISNCPTTSTIVSNGNPISTVTFGGPTTTPTPAFSGAPDATTTATAGSPAAAETIITEVFYTLGASINEGITIVLEANAAYQTGHCPVCEGVGGVGYVLIGTTSTTSICYGNNGYPTPTNYPIGAVPPCPFPPPPAQAVVPTPYNGVQFTESCPTPSTRSAWQYYSNAPPVVTVVPIVTPIPGGNIVNTPPVVGAVVPTPVQNPGQNPAQNPVAGPPGPPQVAVTLVGTPTTTDIIHTASGQKTGQSLTASALLCGLVLWIALLL